MGVKEANESLANLQAVHTGKCTVIIDGKISRWAEHICAPYAVACLLADGDNLDSDFWQACASRQIAVNENNLLRPLKNSGHIEYESRRLDTTNFDSHEAWLQSNLADTAHIAGALLVTAVSKNSQHVYSVCRPKTLWAIHSPDLYEVHNTATVPYMSYECLLNVIGMPIIDADLLPGDNCFLIRKGPKYDPTTRR